MTDTQGAHAQPEALRAAPPSAYSQEDRAFYTFWYGHMLNEWMQPPLAGVSHSTARYIWDAAIAHAAAPAQPVPAGYALVPVEPSAEMVDAAQEAYMPFGDMQLAIQLAIAAAPQPVEREPLSDEQIEDLLICGNPTDEEKRLIRMGWDAAHGIKGGQHGTE